MHKSALALAAGLTILAACGGSAPIVVGTWVGTSVAGDAVTVIFHEDGTYHTDEQGPTTKGVRQATDGRWKTTDATTFVLENQNPADPNVRTSTSASYYVSSDGSLLLLSCLRPEGSHKGVVGTWSSIIETNSIDANGAIKEKIEQTSARWTVAADGTATRVITSTGVVNRTTTENGTWTLDATHGQVTFTFGNQTQALTLVDDQALGMALHRK